MQNVHAQALKPIKVMYSYDKHNLYGNPITCKIFYIIGKNEKEMNGLQYFPFTFALLDSTVIDGYIRYDRVENRVKYIDKYYVFNNKWKKKIEKENTLFSFNNDSLKCSYISILGGVFTMDTKVNASKDTVKMKITSISLPTDIPYLSELFFTNKLYPCKIGVTGLCGDDEITLNAEILTD